MSELGDVLELLHGASPRFERLHAEFRTWRHDERAAEAWEAHVEESKDRGGVHIAALEPDDDSDEEDDPEIEGTVRIWIEGADRLRKESGDPDEGETISVRSGSRWWYYSADGGALTGDVDDSVESADDRLDVMLDPACLVGLLDLEPRGRARRAGRNALRVLARPRRPTGGRDAWDIEALGEGADEYELEIDAERGVLLRLEARRDGLPFSIVEAEQIEFDEPIAAELFTYQPPGGEAPRTVEEAYGRNEFDLPIDQAARRAPFRLFIPAVVPDEWRLTVTFVDASMVQPEPLVVLDYRSKDATAGLMIVETGPAGLRNLGEGAGLPPLEEFTRDGVPMRARGATEEWHESQLEFVKDDTVITMSSRQLDVDALAGLPMSLVPAPEDPPQI
jgi:hypothetical protein